MKFQSSGTLALMAVAFVAAVAMTVSYPRASFEPSLGANWQCSRVAFLLTSCSQIGRNAKMAWRATIAAALEAGTAVHPTDRR
ncbi:hypothetical protein SAMN05216338_105727 [Bradyrhizobium sp. Rc2d]|uniref:hypothetical protein n=1 Tax=Bradyrhizobium sp. Rc2d TaxID=1855321 RepID=UPI0008832338|nr:hypothetical protein [Bradyrhizobium sp. Rc2d]SDJ63173.1 hypothetical protein SAMN05216338_105727 [Bradyrhizobium sp. Rc2d]